MIMPLFKNMANQKVPIFAYNSSGAVVGNAANITGSISKNGAAAVAISSTNPAEVGGGWYVFTLTQEETNADLLLWFASSSTTGVTVEGATAFTVPGNNGLQTVDISSIGGDMVDPVATLESSLASGAVTGLPTTTSTPLVGNAFSTADDAYVSSGSLRFWLWPTTGMYAGVPRLITDYVGNPKRAVHEAYPTPLAPSDEVKIVTQLTAA